MSVEGLRPNPLETFGGWVSLPDPSDVPPGMSPECQDVIFSSGRVQSRPGLGTPFPDQGAAKINGLKTYVKIDLSRRLIVLLSTGVLKVERTAGVLDTITTNLKTDLLYKSVTLFGREYMAFSQDGIGEEFPFYFDDVNFLRVSPSGPGAAPTAVNDDTNDQDYNTGQDEDHELTDGGAGNQGNLGQAIQFQANVKVQTIKLFLKSIGAPAGFVRIRLKEGAPDDTLNPDNVGVSADVAVGSIGGAYAFHTFTFPEPLDLGPLPANGQYHIVFEGDAAYDAAYVAATDAIVWGADGSSPTYAFGSFVSYDGAAWFADLTKDFLFEVDTISGVISQGVHKVMVWFETDTGYWTKASPSFSWTADGNKAVALSNIPVGPSYVVARRVAFTIAAGEEFYHVANTMRIGDNTTTDFLVDFTDSDLLASQLVDKQLRALQLPPEACVTSYANRLVWVGERNRMQQWINLGFDGGWNFQTSEDVPLGWTLQLSGGSQETSDVIAGNAYKITGDGSATRGLIFQSAAADQYNSLPLIEAGRAYRVKARMKRSAGMAAGNIRIDLFSSSGSIDTVGLGVLFSSMSDTAYTEFEGELTPALATIPGDLNLRVFAEGTPTAAEFFLIDEIEIWPSDRELNPSTARVSDPDDPEFYDGVTGLISVAQDNGESLRAVFVIRDILYFVKERSLWATRDDGINPPSGWTVEEVSPVVGTFSPHGVASAEDWTVIAGQEGAYYFDGGKPVKISNEIDAEWRRIDWRFSHLIWIINHVEEERLMIGFPDSRTTPTQNEPDQVWMMDYQEGFGDPLIQGGRGRQWAKWRIPANSAAMVERGDARVAVAFYGSNGGPLGTTNPGEILSQDIVGAGGLSSGLYRSDNGIPINASYRTAFLSHDRFATRQLFAYLTAYAYGNGTLDLEMFRPDESSSVIRGWALPGLGVGQRKDLERQINLLSERVSFKFSIDAFDEWFTVAKFVPWSQGSPFDPIRGTN